MITKITSVEELKQIFLEIFLNKTDKVSDVSDESVLNGIAYGCGKLAQRTLTNQAIIEGHIFPDTAYGEYLDNLAAIRGVSPRFQASGSTTYIRLTAYEGTSYIAGTHQFTSTSGVVFNLDESVTVGVNGFAYAKVSSVQSGLFTNVDPLSINKVTPIPTGHIVCTNEYAATGGMDLETDDLFRQRIKTSVNELSRTTMSYLEQVFMKINPKVLRLHKGGIDANGKLNLIVVSINGQDFTQDEFNEIISKSAEYLSLNEILNETNESTLKLNNVDWLTVDVEFRIDIDPSYDQESVRKQIQLQMNKLFDYRYWKYGDKIEWENLLFAAKNVEGVRYVPDVHFYPQVDINVPKYRLPRIRSFIMRDLNGNIIEDNLGVMSDVFYPAEVDKTYQSSVLTTI